MRLVIECEDGVIFVMQEGNKHHKRVARPESMRVDVSVLANNCRIESVLDEGQWMAVDIAKPKKKGKP